MEAQTDATFVAHGPCGSCGSSDANSTYSDMSQWCFSCETYTAGDQEGPAPTRTKINTALIDGDYVDLRSRGLTEKTCRKFGYSVGHHNGQMVQIATYKDMKGRPVAQKIRTRDKKFSVVGDADAMLLYGSWLYNSGKRIVVCEGEIDAMSVAQANGLRYGAISVPHGAQSAKKHLLANLDYLCGFDTIVLMMDQDTAGIEAAQACAEALPVGKVRIAVLPYKDANETLVKSGPAAIISAIFEASEYRPDGIVSMSDMRATVAVPDAESPMRYPYPKLNEKLMGIRTGIVTLIAGSGVGKSTLVREFAYKLHQDGFTPGMLMLEESTKRTAQGLVGIHISKNITVDPEAATEDEITAGFDDLLSAGRNIFLFDHFGSTAIETICTKIRYMKIALGCDVIFLDHISILISGFSGGSGSDGGNERVMIDGIMHRLRVLCSELDLALILVSHLRRPQGDKGHENGASVSLSQMRGSHSLATLSDAVIALQIPSDDPTPNARELVVLKNRFSGACGPADDLQYNIDTGRLRATYDDIPF